MKNFLRKQRPLRPVPGLGNILNLIHRVETRQERMIDPVSESDPEFSHA